MEDTFLPAALKSACNARMGSVFGVLQNLSIQIKAWAASAVLLICLLALGANAYVTSTNSAEGLRILSQQIQFKLEEFSNLSEAITAIHIKIFRYVSWASNSVSATVLDGLYGEIVSELAKLTDHIKALDNRNDLSPKEHSELKELLAKWEKCKNQAKDNIDVGQTDAAMATMMLGQTDDSFNAVDADFEKITSDIRKIASTVRANLFSDAAKTKNVIIIGTVIGFVISAFVTFIVGASIVRPIKSVTEVMRQLSAGNTDVKIGHRDRRDEIGKMVEAIDVFRIKMIEMHKMELTSLQAEQRFADKRRTEMHELAGEFERSIQRIAKELAEAVSDMHGNAEAMALIAAQTRTKSRSIAGTVVEAQGSVDSVASASTELAQSIEALAAQTQNARAVTDETVVASKDAHTYVQELLKSVNQIVPITGLIQAIAQQTNLLALNATIEAARAGAAGKGFAVVAAEVKALAQQTTNATGEINQRIEAVNASCAAVVTIIEHVTAAIGRLGEGTTEMAASVGQQSAATQEISRNVQLAADASRVVSSSIVELDKTTHENDQVSGQALAGANQLLRHAAMLKQQVDNFLLHVRAA